MRNSNEPRPARPCRQSRKEIMKKQIFGILPLIVGGGLVLSGCVNSHRLAPTGPPTEPPPGPPTTTTETTRTVVVTQAPPPPRTEAMPPQPSQTQVWVSGFWTFTNGRWVWMPGHWELRPRAGAVWVPGHWDQSPDSRTWVWTPGFWQ